MRVSGWLSVLGLGALACGPVLDPLAWANQGDGLLQIAVVDDLTGSPVADVPLEVRLATTAAGVARADTLPPVSSCNLGALVGSTVTPDPRGKGRDDWWLSLPPGEYAIVARPSISSGYSSRVSCGNLVVEGAVRLALVRLTRGGPQ
ncbi:MAG: hypothetical protein AB7L66_23050 [Gemmatimonadales bacterium]